MKFTYKLDNRIRLDHFLSNEIPEMTRTKINTLIKMGNVIINDNIITKSGYKLSEFDEISIKLNYVNETFEIKPWFNSGLLDIIKEEKDYLIINKPAGLSVHPGAGNKSKTLVNILIAEINELSQVDSRPGIVHRLDKNTSGLMIISKNDKFHVYITNLFKNREIKKEYYGLVDGHFPNKQGIIDAPIGRDLNDRKKMTVTNHNSKEAITKFEIMKRYLKNDLIKFNILTGRTHQIRVHSNFLGKPIHNDPEYGKSFEENGQYLHSKSISFVDLDNNIVKFAIDLPDYFIKKIKILEKEKKKENNNVKN